MSEKVFLSARFDRWREMQGYALDLAELGYTVVSSWHSGDHVREHGDNDSAPSPTQQEAWARQDIADLKTADYFITFTEDQRGYMRGGRHVEFGMALCCDVDLIAVVGPTEHIFHTLADEFYDTWEELLREWST